jgi:cob(I)alamin adenosyltransferase
MESEKDTRRGMIHVYTGDGKGKTTAALGLALRAVGRGMRVIMLQFLKSSEPTGEILAAEKLKPWLTILPMGRKGFIGRKGPDPEDRRLAEEAVKKVREIYQSASCDLLILDEINVAVAFGLVSPDTVLELMREKPPSLELVLTGRNADPRILEGADLVTEMKMIKHYFEKGIGDREGIER